VDLDLCRELYGLKRRPSRPAVTPALAVKGPHPCQACAGTLVHRDRPAGWGERLLLPLLGLRAYRCVDCGHRFRDRPRLSRVAVNLKKGASPRLPELARG
jgi:hypothetical protein